MSTIRRIVQEELKTSHARLLFAKLLSAPLPLYTGGRVRAFIFRKLLGFKIGPGTLFFGTPTISGAGNIYANLTIGDHTLINIKCFLDLTGPIDIGSKVAIGAESMLITGTHRVGDPQRRASTLFFEPVKIGDGAWLGSRCVIFPGVTIGNGAIVAAGSVVYKDVAPNTMVGGNPARMMQKLAE